MIDKQSIENLQDKCAGTGCGEGFISTINTCGQNTGNPCSR